MLHANRGRDAGEGPPWAEPPAGSAPPSGGPVVAVRVRLLPDVDAQLRCFVADLGPTPGEVTPKPWLTRAAPGAEVQVRLGPLVAGHLDEAATARWGSAVAAAAEGGRWLSVRSLLTGRGEPDDPWLLRVLLPRGTG